MLLLIDETEEHQINKISYTSRHNNTITIKPVSKNTKELYISKSDGIVMSRADAKQFAQELLRFAEQGE